MAKYAIEDTTLAAIASAIREKTQTSDAMTPLKMPDLIAAISGAPANLAAIDIIEWTPTSRMNALGKSFSHSLGVVPDGFMIMASAAVGVASGTIDTYLVSGACNGRSLYNGYAFMISCALRGSSAFNDINVTVPRSTAMNASSVTFKVSSGTYYYFEVGLTYYVVVYKCKEA